MRGGDRIQWSFLPSFFCYTILAWFSLQLRIEKKRKEIEEEGADTMVMFFRLSFVVVDSDSCSSR